VASLIPPTTFLRSPIDPVFDPDAGCRRVNLFPYVGRNEATLPLHTACDLRRQAKVSVDTTDVTATHATPRRPAVRLTTQEIRDAFQPLSTQFPLILSLIQAAELAGLKLGTLKRKVSEGHFSDCVARRKPLRFWRERFIQRLFNN
jgi:hypothetical protein